MSYKLGKRSIRELKGVHPELIDFVKKLIKKTPVDFGVIDGVRTRREQEKLVARGVSRTYNSYHLWGLAVDLVPYINGKYTWDNKNAFKQLRETGKKIIQENNYDIENGYDLWNWDEPHWQLTGYKTVYDIRKGGFLNKKEGIKYA